MASVKKQRVRVRVSKNRKKSWNKYSDIKDVEEFLEDQRLEERIGGPAAEKTNEELFFFHTGDEKPGVVQVDTKIKKKNLKCHQNLGSYSKVPPPVNKQEQVLGKKRRQILLLTERRQDKKIQAGNPKKAQKTSERSGPFLRQTFHDLWAQDVKNFVPDDLCINELIDYRDEIMRKKPVKVPCHRYQKPSLLPSVEVPHPGASYNPSFVDHQQLLREAVLVEVKKEKEEMHLKRVLTDMFPTKAEAPTQETWLTEMSQGLFDTVKPGIPPESCEVIDEIGNPAVSAEDRLPKSRKRKKKELKKQERTRRLEKLGRKRLHDVFRIKSIKAEIRADVERSEIKRAKKDQIEIEKMYKPRTLSAYKYEPNDLEVNMSEELRGSLRILKVEGNVLEDRFKSLQRRNVIEPRVRQKRKRKYKLKVQVKRSHRNFK